MIKLTRRQLRKLISESIDSDQSEAAKIMSLLTSDDVGSVKQGLDLVDMLGIDPYEYASDKQFFETLSYFLDNEKPEMVKAYHRASQLASMPAYLASKSLQESKSLYDGIGHALREYKWLSDFKFKRHFNEIFHNGHQEIRRLQIELRDVKEFLADDTEYYPEWYVEDEWWEMSKEEVMELRMGEIEDQLEKTIEELNYEAHTAMKAIIFYLDEKGRVSLDTEY